MEAGLGVEEPVLAPVSPPVRVAIVDDHPVVREAFGNLFELVEGLEVVFTAGDAEEALAHHDELVARLGSDDAVPSSAPAEAASGCHCH